jgi:nicotinamide-nucleotide amidase
MNDSAGRVVVAMPGVPHEMQHLMQEQVVPRLLKTFAVEPLLHFHVKTVGIGESQLVEQIATWEEALPAHIKLAYLPSFGQVKLRLTATGKDRTLLQEDIKEQLRRLLPLIDKYVFGFEQETLEGVVAALLRKSGKTIAVAESCTGGYLAHSFTKIPGSSAYFQGGVVTYSNRAKIDILGVLPSTLEKEGAVSEATVLQMATAVRARFRADIGLATSGIAGPRGATTTKPVGTIWVAYADTEGAKAALYRLGNDRLFNIKVTTALLLDWLRKKLGGRAHEFEDFFV